MEPFYSGFLKVNTADIFVRLFCKSGPLESFCNGKFLVSPENVLLLIHGNGEDYCAFQKQIGFLASDDIIVAPDSRGHGKSTFGEGRLTIEKMADDMADVLDALNIRSAAVIGFSDGANIALSLTIHHPDKVSALVSIGANLNPMGVRAAFQLPVIMNWLLFGFLSFFRKAARRKFQILDLMVTQPKIPFQSLENIHVPTLVVAGEKDLIKQKHTKRIAEKIRNSSLEFIPECDHFVLTNAPEITNEKIRLFLYRLSGKTS